MKKISTILVALFFSAGLFAQSEVFKVQGFPRPDIEQPPTALKQSPSLRSDNFTFDGMATNTGVDILFDLYKISTLATLRTTTASLKHNNA
jgi:hypothetical protein